MAQPIERKPTEVGQPSSSFERTMMWLTTISFFVILMTIGVGTILREDRGSSQLENRALAQSVEPTVQGITSGDDMVKMENYFTDQLLLRGTFVDMQAGLSKNVLRQPFRNGIYTAKDGYLIEPSQAAQPVVPDAFQQFTQDVGRPVFFALAPSKTVIAERDGIIPSYVASNAEQRYETMQAGFTKAGITSIPLDALRLSDYFKTDHHWNVDGAYQAYGEIIRTVGKIEPTLKKVEVDPESKRSSEYPYFGSLARKTTLAYASTGDMIEYYDANQFKGIDVCYDKACGQPLIDEQFIKEEGDYADRYEVFMRGNHGILSMTSQTKGPKLLVLKDSFANPVLPFLAKSANLEVVDIRYVTKDFDASEFAKQKNVDAIVFLHNANIAGLMKTYQQKL
ncbi:DHHW family protein [Exiguobacterium antarcticum]|uniref:DHHW family protein n=1 Tax=Exiguobacterium antarcticum TaxID=132920 RepID=A0ABT6QZD1_9BACL|nr:DHHW family protein [Exiguobacterium antarcticum]MDI3234050.1 DHHW family protein [Exiguobacterium antarcticum]